MASSADIGGAAGGHSAAGAHGAPKPEVLAHTGPLLALLVPIFVVVGLATLAGHLTSTGVLIGAIAALLVMTTLVVSGVLKLASEMPDEEDED